MAAKKNWIKGAIKHPGALHEQLGVPQGEPIPPKKLAAAAEKGGKLGARARLAQTMGRVEAVTDDAMQVSGTRVQLNAGAAPRNVERGTEVLWRHERS